MGDGSGEHTGAACGKVILLGEHAVVRGVPAIAAGLPLGAEARVTASTTGRTGIEIEGGPAEMTDQEAAETLAGLKALTRACGVTRPAHAAVRVNLPVRSGLGMSAAMGVALARALLSWEGRPQEPQRVLQAASAWERVLHGNPSGIDAATAALGGVLVFERERGATPLSVHTPLPLCVGMSGRHPATRAMIDKVARFADRMGTVGDQLFQEIGELVAGAQQAIGTGDLRTLGRLMDLNQALLSSLSVSTDSLDRMCEAARRAGALGAKLTGAGGGGCVVALAPGCASSVLQAWEQLGFEGLAFTVGEAGANEA